MAGDEKEHSQTSRRNFFKKAAVMGLGAALGSAAHRQPGKALAQNALPKGPIPRRPFGCSGIKVSTLSLGGMFDIINNRLMHEPRMKAAVEACYKAGIGLTAMKTQGGGPVKRDTETELQMAGRFVVKGFTDHQAKLMAVLEDKRIASICSQMPNLTILGANAAAAGTHTGLSATDRERLARSP